MKVTSHWAKSAPLAHPPPIPLCLCRSTHKPSCTLAHPDQLVAPLAHSLAPFPCLHCASCTHSPTHMAPLVHPPDSFLQSRAPSPCCTCHAPSSTLSFIYTPSLPSTPLPSCPAVTCLQALNLEFPTPLTLIVGSWQEVP